MAVCKRLAVSYIPLSWLAGWSSWNSWHELSIAVFNQPYRYETHMSSQCYLPPSTADILAFTPVCHDGSQMTRNTQLVSQTVSCYNVAKHELLLIVLGRGASDKPSLIPVVRRLTDDWAINRVSSQWYTEADWWLSDKPSHMAVGPEAGDLCWLDVGSRWTPSYVLGGVVGVSKTFQILYRKEDVELYDVFMFKVYMVVDINKVCLSVCLCLSVSACCL